MDSHGDTRTKRNKRSPNPQNHRNPTWTQTSRDDRDHESHARRDRMEMNADRCCDKYFPIHLRDGVCE